MTITPFNHLICPLDGQPLLMQQNSWRCANGHSFDNARQGYVHLLPVQNKRSLAPGDSKEMVAARQRFLNAGHYQPIAAAVVQAVAETVNTQGEGIETQPGIKEPFACLDAGCGEGYYLRQLEACLPGRKHEQQLSLVGLDIAKPAVLAAAKQSKTTRWLVASNANIPLADGSLGCILSLFGFPVYPEFRRVLRPGGRVMVVDAGPDHLRELREVIYPVLKPEVDKPNASEAPPGFQTIGRQTINFSLALVGEGAIADLLAMTPHFYRAKAEGLARAAALGELQVTVDVRLTVLETTPGDGASAPSAALK
ncbi:putative RNA methyltransferase [Marinobacter gelidimuriae]|uniref:putative RNA methyltransferase n=1 Tax=Marinobacter gelidimuriae TaxID=2739064 RepID=UPI00038108D4|nr:methyltransferase domain-containing protein [Marinobacter gelidimuriae]